MLASDVERIQALARSFPSIDDHPAVVRWNPVALDEWASTVASTGERLAAGFVLRVWNCGHEWATPFDVFDAIQRWDANHVAAFQAWAAHPFTL